ncbi:MAG TPA: ATP-binding protein [Verrucomicrobiae bacterium]|nr:ATP-binding protein [Verrucomicrobiae bacterium]
MESCQRSKVVLFPFGNALRRLDPAARRTGQMHIEREGTASLGQDVLNFPDVLRETLASGLVALDPQRRVVLFNSAAAVITGLDPASVLHQPVRVLPAGLAEALVSALESGSEEAIREITLTRSPRADAVIRVSTHIDRSPDGRPARVVAVLNDLSAVRAFEQSMRRIDRLASIGTLSAGMAHEIKNAMVAVKTFVDILIRNNQDAQLAEVVDREMKRINAIVSQMLRFAGPAEPTFALIRVHDVLEQSIRVMEHHLEGRKIFLHRELRAVPDLVRGDGYQLEQVFLNLFFNALDAMGPNGRLTITTDIVPAGQSELPGMPALRVRVQDSGVGIPPENLARLFEPFFTTKSTGTGLGLAITRRIIQEHHGLITVDSQPGQGATFSVLLPRAGPPGGA